MPARRPLPCDGPGKPERHAPAVRVGAADSERSAPRWATAEDSEIGATADPAAETRGTADSDAANDLEGSIGGPAECNTATVRAAADEEARSKGETAVAMEAALAAAAADAAAADAAAAAAEARENALIEQLVLQYHRIG